MSRWPTTRRERRTRRQVWFWGLLAFANAGVAIVARVHGARWFATACVVVAFLAITRWNRAYLQRLDDRRTP